ncbi:MAG: carboxypeptidase regulatory-like domain-containing protein [Bacteroidetes bacterium]|nr:carboxypeptidase regulatory-like domain-containing protein [Bacteroidota bacterium]
MKKKTILLLGAFLLGGLMTFAGNGGKDNRKEDPDMLGVVVQSDSRKPLKDVSVTAYTNSKKEKVTVSDANGNFNLIDLKPGVYKFVFEKEGFKKVVREKVVLKTNEDYQLNIEMMEDLMPDLMPSTMHFMTMS